jgi:hypothetical protein
MAALLSDYLRNTIEKEMPNLRAISDSEASISLRNGWTRKQELGHLIDSATNNHVRFVNIAMTDHYAGPSYDPDMWVATHRYSEMLWSAIVEFWYQYNVFLAGLISRIPEARLKSICEVGSSGPVTFEWLIGDYVVHLQHHVDQLLGRDRVTQYPQAKAASRV